jgi:SSS family solute:Na+ symporter
MMGLGSLYAYLQDVQSLLAPSIVAVFLLGILKKLHQKLVNMVL